MIAKATSRANQLPTQRSEFQRVVVWISALFSDQPNASNGFRRTLTRSRGQPTDVSSSAHCPAAHIPRLFRRPQLLPESNAAHSLLASPSATRLTHSSSLLDCGS